MKNKINIVLLLTGLLFGGSSCLELQPLTLYEEVNEEDASAKAFEEFGAKVIYADNPTDEVWGLETKACISGQVVNEGAHAGSSCLHFRWDRSEGCDWAGFGIGWARWAGKDLSEITNGAAIEMWIKAKEGKTNYIPVILILEDYGGKMTASPFNALSLGGEFITSDKWTKATIPLSSFPYKKDGMDMSNVKQINFELQGKGEYFFDEIKIVEYNNDRYRSVDSKALVNNTLPQILFSDFAKNAWGISTGYCENFSFTEESRSGSKAIHAKYPSDDKCDWKEFGLSWNGWERTDISGLIDKGALQFYVKSEVESKTLPASVVLMDYDFKRATIKLDNKYLSGSSYNEDWQKVRIPLKDFDFEGKGVNPEIMRELLFSVKHGANFLIDDIEFVALESN